MIFPSEPQTPAAVADHYDELDPFYREIWGRHVHHGLWITGHETPEVATEALVELVARELSLAPGHHACDIGCGYGASAASLARRHDIHVIGLTLSPVQAREATRLSEADPRLTFACADWLANDLSDRAFDAAYAIESSEHMADKAGFFRQAFRVLRPGGRLVVCAWLARESPSSWEVRYLLEPICREGRLPGMGTQAEYRALAERTGFQVLGVQDVSVQVRRTWAICARRLARRFTTSAKYRKFLLSSASRNRVFALTLARLILAYRIGVMRYGIVTLAKP